MLEGLIQSYLDAFGRAWVPRCELAHPVHDQLSSGSRLTRTADTGIGSGHATRPKSKGRPTPSDGWATASL